MANHDPFDFSRFLGGNLGFGMPGIVTPTLDVDELDKKIKDLKAVEGWLSMNLSMLQMSIQGLEVQRNTLSSLKAMGEAFNQSMSDVHKAAKENAAASATSSEAPTEQPASEASSPAEEAPAGMWPWEIAAQAMANLQQQIQANTEQAVAAASAASDDAPPTKSPTEKAASAAKKPATSRKPRATDTKATK